MNFLKQTQTKNQFTYICNKTKQDTKERKFDKNLRCRYENRSVSTSHVSTLRDSKNGKKFVKN